MSLTGTSRHFAAAQQFGRFRSGADIEPLTVPQNFLHGRRSTRGSMAVPPRLGRSFYNIVFR